MARERIFPIVDRILGPRTGGGILGGGGILRTPAMRPGGAVSLDGTRAQLASMRERLGGGAGAGGNASMANTRAFRVTWFDNLHRVSGEAAVDRLATKASVLFSLDPATPGDRDQFGVSQPDLQTVLVVPDVPEDVSAVQDELRMHARYVDEIRDFKLAPSPGPFTLEQLPPDIKTAIEETSTPGPPPGVKEPEIEEQARRWAANLAVGTCRATASTQEEFNACIIKVFPELQTKRKSWLQGRRRFAGLPPST